MSGTQTLTVRVVGIEDSADRDVSNTGSTFGVTGLAGSDYALSGGDGSAGDVLLGILMLMFTDTLHDQVKEHSTGIETIYPVDYCGKVDTRHMDDYNINNRYKSIGSLIESTFPDTADWKVSHTGTACQSAVGNRLMLELKSVPSGGALSFDGKICRANGVVQEKMGLMIAFRYDRTAGKWKAILPPAV